MEKVESIGEVAGVENPVAGGDVDAGRCGNKEVIALRQNVQDRSLLIGFNAAAKKTRDEYIM
jgi:hypothetical protein